MTENKILDPFKPTQPRIPGIADHAERPPESSGPPGSASVNENEIVGLPTHAAGEMPPQFKFLWIGLTLAVALIAGIVLFGLGRKSAPKNSPPVTEAQSAPAPLMAESRVADPKVPMAPGEIATTAQLAKPWSAKRFYFRDPITLKAVPAMVVHLPNGGFWGFSLQEPFGSCELQYVTDLPKLRATYGFNAAYPMVVDPCNGTIFDLTRYGTAPSGLVRGEIAKGSGWRPPTAIEIRTEGNKILAERMER